MKSQMIENANYIKDKENYSDLQVLKSAAGYYIGTIYNNPEGYQEPGSRDSDYYPTRQAAQIALDTDLYSKRPDPTGGSDPTI